MIGDYVAGTNHVLPTGGTARFASALRVADFQKHVHVVHARRDRARTGRALRARVSPTSEGLAAHADAVRMREPRAHSCRPRRPQPRDDLRALEGYHSPQVDVDVRLNTNESPYPPPAEFVDRWLERAARRSTGTAIPTAAQPSCEPALGRFLGQPAERGCCAATAATKCCKRSCSPTAGRAGGR